MADVNEPSKKEDAHDAERASTDLGVQSMTVLPRQPAVRRSLTTRHIQMIAIGSNIGTGLFIGTGAALKTGGPAALLIAFLTISFVLYLMMAALTEVGIHYPVSGSFVSYAARFVDPAVGFAVGWQYWGAWIAVFVVESSAFSVVVSRWGTTVPTAGLIGIFLFVTCLIKFLPVRVFAEVDFYVSSLKIISVIAFIIIGFVLIAGGGPNGSPSDGHYWVDPGAFANGFHGQASIFVTAAFAAGGTEIVGIVAGESAAPRHHLPRATKTVWVRIFVFYVVTSIVITLLVPYTSPNLLGGNNVNASPFVIAINETGIAVFPDILNAVILICVLSVGTSSLYASARMMMYMATAGMAPQVFSRVDKYGRPIMALILTSVIGMGLSFLNLSETGAQVFSWFSSLSGTGFFIFWITIFIANWRWRVAQKVQGVDIINSEDFTYRQWGYPWTTFAGFITVLFILLCNGYTSIDPVVGEMGAVNFFANYLGVPVALVMWAGWKIWHRTWWFCVKPGEVDLDFGRRILRDHPEERRILEEYAAQPWWRKVLSYLNI